MKPVSWFLYPNISYCMKRNRQNHCRHFIENGKIRRGKFVWTTIPIPGKSNDFCDNIIHGEAQPFIKRDCSISIGIHSGEHGLSLLGSQRWKGDPKSVIKKSLWNLWKSPVWGVMCIETIKIYKVQWELYLSILKSIFRKN